MDELQKKIGVAVYTWSKILPRTSRTALKRSLSGELVEKLLLPHTGVAFDPFAGRGTVGKVAKRLGMDYILFDISEVNLEIARRYIQRSDAGNYRRLEQRRNKPKVTEEGEQKELLEESFAK